MSQGARPGQWSLTQGRLGSDREHHVRPADRPRDRVYFLKQEEQLCRPTRKRKHWPTTDHMGQAIHNHMVGRPTADNNNKAQKRLPS